MIEFIFTLDYEIYGNGIGSLRELVHEPMEVLRSVFRKWRVPCVVFVEAAELEVIEKQGSDPYSAHVRDQVRDLWREGFEIGLHLHPQWYAARWGDDGWQLDASEYNLCTLPRARMTELVERSVAYLQSIVGDPGFRPTSFRAGNWLFQPTDPAGTVLAENGIRVDSSVFKGGLQRRHGLDYRPARKNGAFWQFSRDVNVPDPKGTLLEIPIYTRMVPFWQMLTSRRVGLQRRSAAAAQQGGSGRGRAGDYLRLSYPMKLDFCRMTAKELKEMVDLAIIEARGDTESIRPVVAIGHTKDLVDVEPLESLLGHLAAGSVSVSRLDHVGLKRFTR
jgi:hypothetical protein